MLYAVESVACCSGPLTEWPGVDGAKYSAVLRRTPERFRRSSSKKIDDLGSYSAHSAGCARAFSYRPLAGRITNPSRTHLFRKSLLAWSLRP